MVTTKHAKFTKSKSRPPELGLTIQTYAHAGSPVTTEDSAKHPEPITLEPLLNDREAAQLLGDMHPRTLQRLARSKAVPAIKIGRFWFFRASALNAWVDVKCGHRPCFSKETE